MFDLEEALSDPRRYEHQLDRLHERFLFTRHLYTVREEGVSLAALVHRKASFARVLARTVTRGAYTVGPAVARRIVVDHKERVVYSLGLIDAIVHGVVSRAIDEAMAPHLSPRLFSYRKAVSWITPIREFASHLREHRNSRPDARSRGLYILRRDIHAYTDSIPLVNSSRIWPLLDGILQADGAPIRHADRRLLEQLVRPDVIGQDGRLYTLARGVPTGQPLSCVLFNLYLLEFDHEIASIPGVFYARYCDDVLIAHADACVVRAIDGRIDERLAELQLAINPEKRQDLYLTAAGRGSLDWPAARGTTMVPFLGCRVSAAGTISLGKKKVRRLLHDLDRRARRTARAASGADSHAVGRLVCRMVNRTLDPHAGAFQQRSARLLRRAVTDRQQLRQLDRLLAELVARAVTGATGVRVFRSISYRAIREEWGLQSVERLRNAWPRT